MIYWANDNACDSLTHPLAPPTGWTFFNHLNSQQLFWELAALFISLFVFFHVQIRMFCNHFPRSVIMIYSWWLNFILMSSNTKMVIFVFKDLHYVLNEYPQNIAFSYTYICYRDISYMEPMVIPCAFQPPLPTCPMMVCHVFCSMPHIMYVTYSGTISLKCLFAHYDYTSDLLIWRHLHQPLIFYCCWENINLLTPWAGKFEHVSATIACDRSKYPLTLLRIFSIQLVWISG